MLMKQPDRLPSGYGAIKKKIDSDYSANQALWQIFWTESSLDSRLEAGDTTLMAELNQQLPNNNRGSWYFNRVRPLCNMVSGYQRRNRKSTIVVPLENGDQKTADQWTKILMGIYKREGVYEALSDAFHHGSIITGMNLIHAFMDYTSDPVSGDIKIVNRSFNNIFIDPYFRNLDLSDASFVWVRNYMSHTEAAMLLPEYYDEIMALQGNPTGTGRDGRFQYAPESYGQTQQNRLAYDEYYYRDYRKQKILVDKETGEVMEITNQDSIDIEEFLKNFPQVTLIEQNVPTVRLAIMVQDKVFYDGPQPLAIDCYPFVPVVGFYNPMMPYFYSRIQGLCRSLRDPQILYNRRLILSMDAAESVVNTGFIFKENAVIDVKHLFQTGQGRIIPLKEEAAMTDIQPITPPNIPPSFFQLGDILSKELNLVSGINEELMGSALDDKAGILSALRQGAGLTTLQPLFDKLDYAQNLLGNLIMKIVQANYTPGKIKKILEGEEPAPLFYNKAFGKYHCTVELGLNTETQKQMQLAQMLQLREMGINIPEENILDAAQIQNKDRIIETLKAQQQQAQQLQQQQAMVQMEEIQSRTNLARARATADEGLGYERMSRIAENQQLAVERQAKAEQDHTEAMLNRVKALKEIEGVDLEHLERLLALARILKQEEENINPQPVQKGSELR